MLDYINPDLRIDTNNFEIGEVQWRSPSNLAIIKYWGKHGLQLPRNPSISFTLETAATETKVEYLLSENDQVEVELFFEGIKNEAFEKKTTKFFEGIADIFPFVRQLKFIVYTSNSFPHSAGIASSASGMSALALCLCSIEQRFFGTLSQADDFLQKASFVSRLGSGSACRSIYPEMAIWGESPQEAGTSDLYATPFIEKLHPVFKTFHDDILIVHKGEKSVSSSAGHALMENNIYAANRYQQARQRFQRLLSALRSGDVEVFGHIAENEALTLHALMMTSYPSYILMQPNSLLLIQLVQQFRKDTGHPLYFSLDAGPNLHLLYPDEVKVPVQDFIKNELAQYCVNGEWIADYVGQGPRQEFTL